MNATVSIPADELYWGVLEVEHGMNAGAVPLRELALLEERFGELIPLPLDSVKTAYVAIDKGRVLAVAAQRERIAQASSPQTVILRPAGLPTALAGNREAAPHVHALNLLWGDLEPRPVIAARRKLTLTATAAIVLMGVAVWIGFERRTAALHAGTEAHRQATAAKLRELYPKVATQSAAQTQLDRDLARLVRTRTGKIAMQSDASDAVAALLAAWPRGDGGSGEVRLRTESLTATAQSLKLNVALEDRASGSVLSDRLRTIPGWQVFQPTFSATGQGTAGGTLSIGLAASEQGAKEARP